MFNYKGITSKNQWNIVHAHQGMEFLYIHEGNGCVIMNQHLYEIRPGTLIFFQPFQLHGVKVEVNDSALYNRSMILLDPSAIERQMANFPRLLDFFRMMWKEPLNTHIVYEADKKCSLDLFLYHQNELVSQVPPKDKDEALELLIISFFQYIKPLWGCQERTANTAILRIDQYTEKIMAWIEQNYHKEFKLEELCNLLHLSSYHICHLFHNATGTSISDYLAARRIRQACWLLKSTSLPIHRIALEVGLTNTSYFSSLFKRLVGMTPMKYRKSSVY